MTTDSLLEQTSGDKGQLLEQINDENWQLLEQSIPELFSSMNFSNKPTDILSQNQVCF